MEVSLSERATSGGTFRKTSRHCPTGGSDYGYILHPYPSHWMGESNQQGTLGGFSDCSHANGETWEQEEQIAENIYDWWISGKSYKKWYVERFVQLWLKFD